MKKTLLAMTALVCIFTGNANAEAIVTDEVTFSTAINAANIDSRIQLIVFAQNAQISLTKPIIYTGTQKLTLQGNGATIDGAKAGSFILDSEFLAHTQDASLVFKTSSDITINQLSVVNSATRGIVVEIPDTAQGQDIKVTLNKVQILNSALYGLHVDDNVDEFDDGELGSEIGIKLYIAHSKINQNGIGAIDFDGIRIDERGLGTIEATIFKTQINNNGGDGLELDESGAGHVIATLKHVSLNDNGYYNKVDLDDGFDIDEGGAGNIEVTIVNVQVNNSPDEGLDFDEAGAGNVKVKLEGLRVQGTLNEGVKVDEAGSGNVDLEFSDVIVAKGEDDGIQVTERDAGRIVAELQKVSATDNKKYGIIMQQWEVIGGGLSPEEPGALKYKELTLSGNGSGNQLELHNVAVE